MNNVRSTLVTGQLYRSQRHYYQQAYGSGQPAPWDTAFDGKWLEKTLKKIGRAKNRRALDIGAGNGKGAWIINNAGWRTFGLDYIFEPISAAATSGGGDVDTKHKRPVSFILGDVFEPPFSKNSFGLILDWGVFHHIRRSDSKNFLDTLSYLLAPSGVFLLGCFSRKFKHKGEGPRKRNWTRHHGHYDRFSSKGELVNFFSGQFSINSIEEDPKGFYLLTMTKKTKP